MEKKPYDSIPDTSTHILRVQTLLSNVRDELEKRGLIHDQSKLEEPEKSAFDRLGELKLSGMAYGSPEYRACLKAEAPAIQHHYAHNSHHPEHFRKLVCIICFTEYPSSHKGNCKDCGNGTFTEESFDVGGMSLLDVIEMLIDWKAAGERMEGGGDIRKSCEINRERFKISDQLYRILVNTVKELGW